MYTPVVEFHSDCLTYCFRASISSTTMPYEVGETVPVLYRENDPHDARILTNLRYIFGGVFLLRGSIALAVGVTTFRTNSYSVLVATSILVFFGVAA